MRIPPLDTTPGLSVADRELLNRWRQSPDGKVILTCLCLALRSACATATPPDNESTSSFLLGFREGTDAAFDALYLIGTGEPPKKSNMPMFRQPPTRKESP